MAPKEKTLREWKERFDWLVVKDEKLICKTCVSQKSKIKLDRKYNPAFVNGSTNYKRSALKEHEEVESHIRAVREQKHEDSLNAGKSLPKEKVTFFAPVNAPIKIGMDKMQANEREGLKKLFNTAFYIAQKGRPFTDYEDIIALQTLNGADFNLSCYQNKEACRDFINSIADYFFDNEIGRKLKLVNFVGVLCDGSTDKSIMEQEAIYVTFVDPDTLLPVLKFFNVVVPESQDAVGIKNAIISCFEQHGLADVIEKIVFIGSDGASVNCGKNSGLVKQFQDEFPYISFVWCFSHRLERSLEDALKIYMEPVDTSLLHLYYLYEKSSKKTRELKLLYQEMKDIYNIEGNGIKPVRASGTRWVEHKLNAMTRLVEKFGVYTQHLQNVIADTSKQCDRATVKGKFEKLVHASVLLRSSFFVDLLGPAKELSMVTQKNNLCITEVVEAVENTKRKYQRLLRRVSSDEEHIFRVLPTFRNVLAEIEEESNNDTIYQGQKIEMFIQQKEFLKNNAVEIISKIVFCLEERYGNLYSEDMEREGNASKYALSDEGDAILFDICRVLNTVTWPTLSDDVEDDSTLLEKQIESLTRLYRRYEVKIPATLDELIDSYTDIVKYANRYFNIIENNPLDIWAKIGAIKMHKENFKVAMLLIELCLCAPYSNAEVERFFNHMKYVKSSTRTSLSQYNLNCILVLKLLGADISLECFDEKFAYRCVDHWYNQKGRRIHQKKRKQYKERDAKRRKESIADISSESECDESN